MEEKKEKKIMVMFGFNSDGNLVITQKEEESSYSSSTVVLSDKDADMLRRFLNINAKEGGKE